MEIIKKIKELAEFAEDDDILYQEYQVCDLLETADDKEKYISYILEIMENNPLADWGCPGPLVHFIESCNEKVYEKLLKESIKKRPTIHTLIMFNRICNVKSDNQRNEYISIFKNIAENDSIEDDISETAKELLEYQLEKDFK
ncbi:MAG: hypothetical protein K2K89_03125 [Ruminococcus sp.]|nr:hypothetical protein [Ruminococcus sp.]